MLRVIVADDEPLLVEETCVYLREMGHQVISTASTGVELVQQARELKPDLIVTGIKMPELSGLEAADQIFKETPLPIIVVSAYHEEELIEQATSMGIMGYLVKPLYEGGLKAAISIATRRFHEFEALHSEYSRVRKTLSDRKTIERAKGKLMKELGLEEEQAFLHLQKQARDTSKRMVDIAQSILDA